MATPTQDAATELPESTGSEAANIALKGALNLKAAAPLLSELQKARGADITIDASEVERVGAQCLQVLLSARNTWVADGFALQIEHPTEGFQESLEFLGISLSELNTQEG